MGELITLVDPQGQIQTRPIPRAEAFANQDPSLHLPIVVVVVFNGLGEVLIQQRSKNKDVDAGKIDLICGVVGAGEDPIDTAVREAVEETGVEPFDIIKIAEGVNIYRRYRYLYIGLTERQGVTIRTPNNEVEWASLIHPDHAQLLSNLYGSVGDFNNHLALAQGQAFHEVTIPVSV